MIKKSLILFMLALCCGGSATAQDCWSGETEAGTDGNGSHYFSQYVYCDREKWNFVSRYYVARNGTHRGEFAVGPTIKTEAVKVKMRFGFTTDRYLQAAGSATFKVKERTIVAVADAKFPTDNHPSTLYNKLFVSLNKSGLVQFRMDRLQYGTHQSYLRLGAEFRKKQPGNTQAYVAPYYDPFKRRLGIQGGFRFF